jgi:hypothetical protein
MAPVNVRLGRLDAAIETGRKAIREYRELSERRPEDHTLADLHFGAMRELGYLFILLDRCDEAVAANRAARETQRAAPQVPGPGLASRRAPGDPYRRLAL